MEQKDLERLEVLRQKNADPAWINGDLYRLMYRPSLYVVAYEKLKSKPGNMTPGPDGSTLDGFSMKSVERIIGRMRDESFQFSRARRVHIPKGVGKSGTRPLGIAPPTDKIVQEVMRMILEAVYDSPHGASFSETSHGFRSGRGCHTALKAIREEWSGVAWIVEGDVKAAFDNVNHDVLIRLLRKRISDERFLNLVRKALTAGYYEFRMPVDSVLGTPQGSVLSPVLSNVYLHALDEFCMGMRGEYECGKARAKNPEYRRIESRLGLVRKKIAASTDVEERNRWLEELRTRRKELVLVPPTVDDGSFIRLKYLRYADDFVVGINGPRSLAETVRERIASFMRDELGLTLNVEKTYIRHAKTEEAVFLGTRISVGSTSPRVTTVRRNGQAFVKRTAGWTPKMLAPIDRLIRRLFHKGFCDANGKPTSKPAWTVLDDDQIVAMTNAVLRGMLNYYSFVDNYSRLAAVQFILLHSAALTLAHKHRLSRRAVFLKYGKALKVRVATAQGKERFVSLDLERNWRRKPNRFLGGQVLTPDQVLREHLRLRTRSKLGARCVTCGTEEDVVMHHVRHIRKMGEKAQGFVRLLATLNRKQIPVCVPCHGKIHRGEYDGLRLSDLTLPALAAD